jgi:hypothetical protein
MTDNPTQPELTPEGASAAHLLSLVGDNPALASDPEIAEFLQLAAKEPEPAAEADDDDPEEGVEAPVLAADDSDDEPEEEDDEIPLIGSPKAKYKFGSLEDVQKHAEKKFGVKDVKGFEALMTNVDTWRNDSQKLKDVADELETIKAGLQSVPSDLAEAINAWSRGEDYRQPLANSSLVDFTKPFAKHQKSEVIKYFYPGQFTEEELEYEEDARIKSAYSFAEKLFEQKKAQLEDQRFKLERDAEDRMSRLADSVEGAVGHLSKTFPSAGVRAEDKKAIKEIEALLKSGDDVKLLSMFKNKDGSVKKDAALMLFLAKNGHTHIRSLAEKIKEQNKGIRTAVEKGKSTPAANGSAPHPQPTADAALARLQGFVPKKYY